VPRRNASARLDPDKIVTAALAVADRQGLTGMTLRMVGAELGADPTAIYRHFSSKEALVAAIGDRLFGEVVAAELPTDWRPRLVALLRAARDVYRAHPALVDVLANQPEDSDNLLAINEVGVRCLAEAGLDSKQIGLFHHVGTVLVIGSGIVEAAWDASTDGDREATRRAYSALDPAKYPAATSAAAALFPEGDEGFDLALELLEAITKAAAQRHGRSDTTTRRPTSRKKTA
jgi:AcrR family transcriptional regulator